MIQRIQTVYLLLAVILCLSSLLATVGVWADATNGAVAAQFGNFALSSPVLKGVAGPYALGVLLCLVAAIDLVAVFLFHFRMRQLRLVIFSQILLVGYVLAYAFFAWLYGQKLSLALPTIDFSFRLRLMAVMPIVVFVLNALAIHGIRKDEALIRSLDRLR